MIDMVGNKWSELISNIEDADHKLSAALGDLDRAVVYSEEFDDCDLPNIDMATSHEIIMSWHGAELFPQEFCDIMDEKGYISPSDFRL